MRGLGQVRRQERPVALERRVLGPERVHADEPGELALDGQFVVIVLGPLRSRINLAVEHRDLLFSAVFAEELFVFLARFGIPGL